MEAELLKRRVFSCFLSTTVTADFCDSPSHLFFLRIGTPRMLSKG